MEKDAGAIIREEEYRKLVDEFYVQNRDMVTRQDYDKAKRDPLYFKALIRRMTDLYQRIGRGLLMNDKNYHVWEKEFKQQKQG